MNIISLQSGSNGNCIYVESENIKLLFDAGISGKQAAERLTRAGRDITDIDALVISHDHSDHIKYAGIYQRKFGMRLCITEKTLRAARSRHELGEIDQIEHFKSGGTIHFGHLKVETIATPHDGADGVSFIIDDGRSRFGIFTDVGHVYGDLKNAVESVDAALIESNYDPAMLQRGPYPGFLKKRITGPAGHISNTESAELIAQYGSRLRWVCLGHLSAENNSPALALSAHAKINPSMICHLADRYAAGDILSI
jgi:phosphoribosyl 1,2-cyclic phosphodiesterase